jgi:serine phosphatase RsbU (regulator of sigma subunit)
MIKNIKKSFQGLFKIPEDLSSKLPTPEFHRSYLWLTYVCLISGSIHFLFIPLFALTGVIPLALFNILSVVTWFGAIFLNRKGHFVKAFFIIDLEILAHAILCVVIIGWGAGFQYYLIIMPMAVFLARLGTIPRYAETTIKVGAVFSHCLCYMLLNYYSQKSTPLYSLNPIILNVLNYANIMSICGVMAVFSYSYTRETKRAEEKLEQEHQRATKALEERNQALVRLNEELAEAAAYVRTMLPKPIIEGDIRTDWRFIPSRSLGGDAFGYHWFDENEFAIYIIDVCGHGVGAALLSASVMNVLRSQSLSNTDFKDPEQVLESLNAAFPSEDNNDMFFTMWYGVYKRSTRELTYASGGHPPALLLSGADINEFRLIELKTPNFIIGGIPDFKYEKRKYKVNKNSRLYVFSDGVYEVEKTDGSMWRFDEFSEFLEKLRTETQPKLDRLYRYAKSLGNSEHLEDDFTIVEVAFG